jgi:hypothetical protein
MQIWLGKQYLEQKDKHEIEPGDGVIPMLVIRREDIAAGCRAYAAHPDCRPELRAVLLGRIPRSVRDAVRGRIPKE